MTRFIILVAVVCVYLISIRSNAATTLPTTEPEVETFYLSKHGNTFILKNEISGNAEDYSSLLISLLAAKDPQETIKIILDNNRGGYVSTMNVIIKAMKDSNATVHTEVRGFAASAAAMILSMGDKVTVDYIDSVMWHTGSLGVTVFPGMTYRFRISPDFPFRYTQIIDSMRYLYREGFLERLGFREDVCVPYLGCILIHKGVPSILTKELWDKILLGEDVWLTGRGICANIRAKVKIDPNDGVKYCTFKGFNDE